MSRPGWSCSLCGSPSCSAGVAPDERAVDMEAEGTRWRCSVAGRGGACYGGVGGEAIRGQPTAASCAVRQGACAASGGARATRGTGGGLFDMSIARLGGLSGNFFEVSFVASEFAGERTFGGEGVLFGGRLFDKFIARCLREVSRFVGRRRVVALPSRE